jgi:hypothetical protein
MAEIEGALGRQFQSLSIVFVCAVNTKLASLWAIKFLLQIYMELTGLCMVRIIIQDGGQLIGIAFSENISRDEYESDKFAGCDNSRFLVVPD